MYCSFGVTTIVKRPLIQSHRMNIIFRLIASQFCKVLDTNFWFDFLYGIFGALEDTRETRWGCGKEIQILA